jgi:hypothetical protein
MNTAISHLMSLKWFGTREESYAEGHGFVFKRCRDQITHRMKFYLAPRDAVQGKWSYKAFAPEGVEWSEPYWQHEGWVVSKWGDNMYLYRNNDFATAILEEMDRWSGELRYILTAPDGSEPDHGQDIAWRTLREAIGGATAVVVGAFLDDEVTKPVTQQMYG